MAAPTRTVKIRFDGSAQGLVNAANRAARALGDFDRRAQRTQSSLSTAGSSLFSSVADALGSLPAQLKGAAIVAGAGLGAAMAPSMASALTAGALLGVGGGGLVAGIIGAARHPKVAAAWTEFGKQAGATLERFSAPFVAPLRRAASTFSDALKRAEPTLRRIGSTLAPVVDRLAPAFASLVERSLPGIERAVKASVPLFDTLAEHAPVLGDTISSLFDKIATGGPKANSFFDKFLTFVETAIDKGGDFLTWLTELGDEFEGIGDDVMPIVSKAWDFFANTVKDNKEDIIVAVKSIAVALGLASAAVLSLLAVTIEVAAALKRTWRTTFNFIAGQIQFFVDAAAVAFGWVPELGPKLEQAAVNFQRFRDRVNAALDGIKNKTIRVQLTGSGARFVTDNGASIPFGGGFQARAHGGPGIAGRTYLTSERGPELVQSGPHGMHVTSNQDLRRLLGQGGGGEPIVIENVIMLDGEVIDRRTQTVMRSRDRELRRRVTAGAR